MNWWMRHVDHTVGYLVAVKSKDRTGMLSSLMHLVDGVAQWGQIVAKKAGEMNGILAHGFMAEHVIGAKLLIDRSLAGDEAAIHVALSLLSRNADGQTLIYGAAMGTFPHAEFRKLLGDHLTATAGYVKDWAAGNEASFESHVAAARKNAMDLDGFTAKNLLS